MYVIFVTLTLLSSPGPVVDAGTVNTTFETREACEADKAGWVAKINEQLVEYGAVIASADCLTKEEIEQKVEELK